MNDVINALKRLERAGSEESRQTEKLREAAGTLGNSIVGIVPWGQEMPRHYYVSGPYLLQAGWGEGERFAVDENREVALAFARDVADGWLDDLAEWLERRSTESAEAIATLERAAEAMR